MDTKALKKTLESVPDLEAGTASIYTVTVELFDHDTGKTSSLDVTGIIEPLSGGYREASARLWALEGEVVYLGTRKGWAIDGRVPASPMRIRGHEPLWCGDRTKPAYCSAKVVGLEEVAEAEVTFDEDSDRPILS